MDITINYGISNSLRKDFPEGSNVGKVIRDPNVKAALGHGDNVVAKIDGVTVDDSRRLVDGDEIELEVRANSKAEIHPDLLLMAA